MRGAILSSLVFAATVAVAAPACSQSDKVQLSPVGDAEMQAAEKQARDSLAAFWIRIQSGDPQIDLALVKVGYPTRHGGTEYLWAVVRPHSAEDHLGQLVNNAEDVAGVRAGQVVTFDPARIGDWSYRKAGKFYGQFTTRVMIKRADPKAAREMAADLAPTPLEPESN